MEKIDYHINVLSDLTDEEVDNPTLNFRYGMIFIFKSNLKQWVSINPHLIRELIQKYIEY